MRWSIAFLLLAGAAISVTGDVFSPLNFAHDANLFRYQDDLYDDYDLEEVEEYMDECGKDNSPSCNSWFQSGECHKNPIVRDSCQFSCSLSGQLWRAAWSGNLEEVTTAIITGANPLCQNTITHDGGTFIDKTAIHMAALANHPGVVKTLLDAGVDVNLQTTQGVTPTYDASGNGSIDALNVLINHNANVNLPAIDGSTPLMEASARGHLSVAKALINAKASIDVIGGWGNATALYNAVRYGNHDIVLLLIEHNANVNLPASNGYTPLMYASRHGHLSIAKALIKANASIDVTGGWWSGTALYYAATYGKHDIVLLLIEHNANVNLPAFTGSTPLTLAAIQGHLSIAKALIKANASIDVTGGGWSGTALYNAALIGNQDIALLLLESGADTTIPNINGVTPAAAARLYGYNQLAALIDSYTNTTGGDDTTGS